MKLTKEDILSTLFSDAARRGKTDDAGKKPCDNEELGPNDFSEIDICFFQNGSISLKVFYRKTGTSCYYLDIPSSIYLDVATILGEEKEIANPFGKHIDKDDAGETPSLNQTKESVADVNAVEEIDSIFPELTDEEKDTLDPFGYPEENVQP